MSLRFHRLIGCFFLIALACLTGCKTTDEAHSGNMASVEISGYSKAEILQAVADVFRAKGYTQMDDLTFEKPGSGWETANYGGWSSSRVWIRMRCHLVFIDIRQYALGCDAYVVEGHGEVGTESEQKFWVAKRTECKTLLDDVKAALKKLPAPNDANDGSAGSLISQ